MATTGKQRRKFPCTSIQVVTIAACIVIVAGCATELPGAGGKISATDWTLLAATPDEQTLLIQTDFGGVASGCARFEGYKVKATDDEVEITANLWEQTNPDSCTDDLGSEVLLVQLSEPVGERRLTGCGIDDCMAVRTDSFGQHALVQSAADFVAVSVHGALAVFDAQSGEPISSSLANGPIALSDDIVIGRDSEGVTGVQTRTGRTAWARPDLYQLVGQSNDVLACGRESQLLAALDPSSGESRWEADVTCEFVATFEDKVLVLGHDPKVDGGSQLFVIDADTGVVSSKQVFDDGVDDQVQGYWGIAHSGDHMVVAGFQSDTVVLDALGNEISRSSEQLGDPVGFDGELVVVQGHHSAGVFDLSSEQWLWDRPKTLASHASVGNGDVALGRLDGVDLVDQTTGEVLWSTSLGHATAVGTTLTDTHVIATTELIVAVLDRSNGELLWWRTLPTQAQSTINIEEG